MALVSAWYREAIAHDPRHALMTLATATPCGRPSARVVRCSGLDAVRRSLTFCTSYRSRKAGELDANPWAATVFYWPYAGRQVRLEGRVERLPPGEADLEYAAQVLPLRFELVKRAATAITAQRPAHLGAFRIIIESVELGVAAAGMLQDRARWTIASDDRWTVQRL